MFHQESPVLVPVALFASVLILQQTPPATGAARAPATAPDSTVVAEETRLPTVNVQAQQPAPTQTCRTETVTGSRFGRRVCRNNAQSDDDRVNSREMLRRMQGSRMPDGG
jgi:hypothetical protein